MFNIDKIKEAITDLDDSDMVALWNDYCSANSFNDDIIEDNEPNIIMYGWDAETVLRRVDLEGNYRLNDRYCTIDRFDEYVSFDYVDDYNSPFDLDSVAQWIYDNEDACGYLDEDDISDHFDAINFVDEFFDDDDVDAFIEDNGIDVDENIDKYDAVKDYLESLDDDTEEIEAAISGLGWLCDIEERVLQYFN